VYDLQVQQFKNSKDPTLEGYPLQNFIDDYYKMNLERFRRRLKDLIGCILDDKGRVVYHGEILTIRDLAFFANKARKFASELQYGRERGNWVKTVCRDVSITTSQTDIISDFIKHTIIVENLSNNDIIMLKYLKRILNNPCFSN
jgi:hypothetical protein